MTDAPERIWADIDEEYTRGAMIGRVCATDIGDIEYIRLDLHEAAVAAARAEGMRSADEELRALLDRAVNGPWLDGDLDRARFLLAEASK